MSNFASTDPVIVGSTHIPLNLTSPVGTAMAQSDEMFPYESQGLANYSHVTLANHMGPILLTWFTFCSQHG